MKIFSQTVAVLFALIFIGALGLGGYYTIEHLTALFLGMDTQIATVTGVASVVVLLAALLVASSIRQAIKQNRTNQFHADKATTYKLFINTWSSLLRERAGRVSHGAAPLPEALQTLHLSLALYGSPAVIKAHTALRVLLKESGTLNPELLKPQFAKALLEVRKDLGSDTRGLATEALQDLLLSDAERPILPDVAQGLAPRAGMSSSPR